MNTVRDNRLQRALLWVRGHIPTLIAGLVLAWHLGVALAYASGRAVSPQPFTDAKARTLLTSPLMPLLHVAAALLLVAAFAWAHARAAAAAVSLGVCFAYALALYIGAAFREPPGPVIAAVAASIFVALGALVLATWEDTPNPED